MKIQILIILSVLCGLNYSCQKCELIDQIITYPPTDTIPTCKGTFYFFLAESAMDTNYSFNTLAKPLIEPLNPVQKAGPFGFATNAFGFRSQFSAYDTTNGIYAFEFYRGGNPMIGFYSNQTSTNISTNSTFLDFFVAPVYQDEHLYVISLDYFKSEFQYSIGEVNPITGQDGVGLLAGIVATPYPPNQEYFSSAAAKNGLVYFLGGTYLIEFNSSSNTATHYDLDPTFNPIDNPVVYFGLEYDPNQDLLLCMKTSPDGLDVYRTTLVSIKVTSSATVQTHVFDIGSNLPSGHSPQINPDFNSTAFDPCDTTYYVTEMNTFNPLTTNFIAVAVNKQSLTTHVAAGYWFGFEYVPIE